MRERPEGVPKNFTNLDFDSIYTMRGEVFRLLSDYGPIEPFRAPDSDESKEISAKCAGEPPRADDDGKVYYDWNAVLADGEGKLVY